MSQGDTIKSRSSESSPWSPWSSFLLMVFIAWASNVIKGSGWGGCSLFGARTWVAWLPSSTKGGGMWGLLQLAWTWGSRERGCGCDNDSDSASEDFTCEVNLEQEFRVCWLPTQTHKMYFILLLIVWHLYGCHFYSAHDKLTGVIPKDKCSIVGLLSAHRQSFTDK